MDHTHKRRRVLAIVRSLQAAQQQGLQAERERYTGEALGLNPLQPPARSARLAAQSRWRRVLLRHRDRPEAAAIASGR